MLLHNAKHKRITIIWLEYHGYTWMLYMASFSSINYCLGAVAKTSTILTYISIHKYPPTLQHLLNSQQVLMLDLHSTKRKWQIWDNIIVRLRLGKKTLQIFRTKFKYIKYVQIPKKEEAIYTIVLNCHVECASILEEFETTQWDAHSWRWLHLQIWYLWQCRMTCKNVTNVIFSNTRKVGLNWSLDATFANHMWMYLQNASSMCKW